MSAGGGADPAAEPEGPAVRLSTMERRAGRWPHALLKAAAVAVLLALVVAAAVALATRTAPEADQASPPVASGSGDVPSGWRELPPSPLGSRHAPLTVTVGEEVLFLGGSTERICPPNASCIGPRPGTQRRDGAAYDVGSGEWRLLAEAPVPPAGAAAAVVGDTVHLLLREGRHLGYDVSRDRWEELPAAPGEEGHELHALVAAGEVLVGYQVNTDRPDHVYDPASRSWTPLPGDPLAPSFDRHYAWTGSDLVLLGAALVPNPGSDGPSFQRAAVLELETLTWERLPDATETITGSSDWSWDGRRVVSAARQFADGGEVNGYGRSYSSGGMLDPATGTWTVLPEGPEREVVDRSSSDFGYGQPAGVFRSGLRYKASGDALFDTSTDSWQSVPTPPRSVYGYSGQAWVGDVLVVWGGGVPFATDGSREGELADTGGVYRP